MTTDAAGTDAAQRPEGHRPAGGGAPAPMAMSVTGTAAGNRPGRDVPATEEERVP